MERRLSTEGQSIEGLAERERKSLYAESTNERPRVDQADGGQGKRNGAEPSPEG